MKKWGIFLILLLVCLCFVVFVPEAFAQNSDNGFKFTDTIFGKGREFTATGYLTAIYQWAVGIAVFSASLGIMWAGFKYVTSRGNPGEISKSKETIVSILVGLLLLLLAFSILQFIGVNVEELPTNPNPPAQTEP